MNYGFRYNLNLPTDIPSILEQDFWMLENIGPSMLATLKDPVKFSASTWIFVKKGQCQADISLINYDIKGPSLVIVENSQILAPNYISSDFEASIIVLSKNLRDNLFLLINQTPLYTIMSRHPVVSIPNEIMEQLDLFFSSMRDIVANPENTYTPQALIFTFASFIFSSLYKCYDPYKNEITSNQGRMSDQFLMLAQNNFKKERFLDFYAKKLEVTPKHLSRTVKSQTGYSAVEWIERLVILEAKVLLKSSNLNIQQVADELNFHSQSFFGKYFKKLTGMSPKEFRNSQ